MFADVFIQQFIGWSLKLLHMTLEEAIITLVLADFRDDAITFTECVGTAFVGEEKFTGNIIAAVDFGMQVQSAVQAPVIFVQILGDRQGERFQAGPHRVGAHDTAGFFGIGRNTHFVGGAVGFFLSETPRRIEVGVEYAIGGEMIAKAVVQIAGICEIIFDISATEVFGIATSEADCGVIDVSTIDPPDCSFFHFHFFPFFCVIEMQVIRFRNLRF